MVARKPGAIHLSLPSPPGIKGASVPFCAPGSVSDWKCALGSHFLSLSFGLLGFWVHCNDSKLNVCSVEEVCKTQAYILFYTQRTVQGNSRISETQLQAQVQPSTKDEGQPQSLP